MIPPSAATSASSARASSRGRRALFGLRAAAVVFVLALVAARWDGAGGFTALIRFQHEWAERRVAALAGVPVVTAERGYDGQFYAQLAVAPEIAFTGEQVEALDRPAYRARRIGLPLAAWALGGGAPWWVLQGYALLNVAAWLALAWVWWREVRAHEAGAARATAVWLACLLSLGALDSVRQALTDLPAVLLLVLGARAMAAARPRVAALWLLAAGFVRETSVLAAGLLRASGGAPTRTWGLRALAVLPVLAWCAWLAWRLPGGAGFAENFDWPGAALARHVLRCAHALAAGDFDSRFTFGLLGALSLAVQSVYILLHWRAARGGDVWLRLGLPFALLFWVLGEFVFTGYWAAMRACLPLTFVFNRALLRERRFVPLLILGNLTLPHALWRMLP